MKKIISFAIAVSIIVPTLAFAQTANTISLQAQIQLLLQELAQLQSQSNGTTTIPATSSRPVSIPSYAFTTNMTIGSQGTEVSNLQQILINGGYLTAVATPTGYFGPATKTALTRYQEANGIAPATGYFGAITMSFLNKGSLPTTNAPITSTPPTSQSSTNNTSPAQPENTTVNTTPISTPQTAQDNWNTYQSVAFSIFQNNPNAYINQNISVIGLLDGTFLPASNGAPNYIEVQNAALVSAPVEIAIPDQSNYTLAVNALSGKYEPIIKIYGAGATMQEFTMTNGTSKTISVITAQRIDICNDGAPSCSLGTTSIFPTGLSTPSTITQPASTPTPTPVPTSIITPTPTSTSSAAQCNFNGNVFSCTQNSQISASPTSLPNAIVGTSYNQPISVTDPNTSSQSLRWNIISGSLPPGIGFAFSPSQALECSGTYCFFTTPPSGLSYPSNNAGDFFGTPTATGTYSFTLQAIDSLNYFNLLRFTLNIASATPISSASTYTITASAEPGGTISPSGKVVVQSGASQTFEISANPGYDLDGKTVDGVNQGGQMIGPDSWTFTNVISNHTIVADFFQQALATVTASPATASLSIGSTQQLTAVTRDQAGLPFPASVIWTSSNPAVATVDANGLVTAVSPGVTNITASSGTIATVTWIPSVITVQ